MMEQPFKHISCSVVVLRIEPAQLIGDEVAEALREEFLSARKLVGARHVIIDFQAVAYLSSASFRPLLSLVREVRADNGRLVLCHLQPDVHEVFTVTRLISGHGSAVGVFEVQPDVAAAVASLSSAGKP